MTILPTGSSEVPLSEVALANMFSPVLVLDDGVNDLLHLLGEGRGVGGELLGGRAAAFLCFLPVVVLVPPAAAAGAGRGRPAVVVAVPLALSGGLFVAHFLLDVL